MELLKFEEIVEAIHGKIHINSNCHKYNSVSTDTRKINEDSIFIALKGDNFNANDYIVEASKKGANLCIVDEIKFNENDLQKNTSVILVKNTRKALLDLAELYRSKLNIKVIGITGSTGKTSTKDLTAAALSSKFKVFKTQGNFNNEIGLPLMIFNLDNTYDIAVLEMGMSDFSEIHRLAKVARPDIALITNIGISHIENLKTRENILKAKMEITDFFNEDSILIVNNENDLLKDISSDDYKVISIGFNEGVTYKATDIITDENHIEFTVCHNNKNEKFNIPVPGKHNILNSLLAIAAGRVLNIEYDKLKEGIKNLSVTSMRLDIVKGKKFTIVDDCYNASPDSMKAAIDVMNTITGKRKIAVLGTMKELGVDSYKFHKEVAEYANSKNIDLLITVGEFNEAYKEGFNKNSKQFETIEDAAEFTTNNINKDDIILVKASRSMKFEYIVNKLKDKNC
ncbi:UDP-N-acetylmuramoyl-tripeptide--D-alanyl-D-alanine ligase [Clostridium botulinum]|uniref:UDP-N-acetylmuramoyl-tripeptide--D-alanyl-D-alanine ligase n=1 Tax=Clostridium botulinum D str. 1873 TaxID=592027 RepID=A0A9P2LL64_CLOBO|nr:MULTISPECIES: UDP-N-acetylmuramoyl-tripeptide--D-alanyl-D-alanine ligase [Clostridium]EES91207.1 UDP-N-acetylmuramoyl-tripeptide--D-alanyl-D-alanine ligase [Clostridium botulinum D str. 1873]MBO3441928.1 UDP-N-acetylmuramoyl-tripeptide--D-alanyl-D-alanine ligase [Clostridium haemolyticum]MCD3244412.1 UDP-N-acetylmuramoyl-tripeptide--D-alanyl-D-alanine ligase [Clostridium botulinum C]MCD3260970.1 UDP-N-acetylmuramoyl-tripeptide--D-alanyl-D-alanine ligase [Clostridium botulinum C]NFV46822.1 U